MGYIGVTATHISREVSGRSKFGFDGSHNDLTDLVVPHVVPVLVSAASCSSSACESMSTSQHTEEAGACKSVSASHHPGGGGGGKAGACESMSASHHPGGRSCCPSTNDGAL